MPVADVAEEFNLAVDEAEELLKLAKEKLWNYREEKRAKPHCDDKVKWFTYAKQDIQWMLIAMLYCYRS